MELLAAFNTLAATSSSPTISINPGKCSSLNNDLSLIYAAHCANIKLSLTMSFNSGKCQEYHSLTLMANVLMSLSIWSNKAIDWMIMLSARPGLNLTYYMRRAVSE